MATGRRRCTQCKEVKDLEDFYRDAKGRDGRQSACKECHNARVRDYRARLRERNKGQPPPTAPKRCGRCKRVLGASAFHRNRSTPDGLHWTCRTCNTDPETRRAVERRRTIRNYDLTREEFDAMVVAQDQRCAICDQVFTDTPHIDHDHATGVVRGLLCRACNVGLGLFDDRVERLLRAIRYLGEAPQ